MVSGRLVKVPSKLGPCTDLAVLGQGSMGTVYRAWHTTLEREVAVKVVDPRLSGEDPVMVKRFIREVGLLGRVDHPHVIQMIEAGQAGNLTYAIMELVVGQSLQRVKDEQPLRRLTPSTAAFYLVQIARGLTAVHAHGIVHRDLKPANVMIDTRGQARIADFGLARGQDSSTLTRLDEVVGTPEYMAPETIEQHDVDGRADLYALGITAYELLSGDTPFHEGGVLRVVQDQVHTKARPLTELNPEVSPELAEVVHKLLAKQPARRYANAVEAAAAFEPFAARLAPLVPTPEVRLAGTRMPSWAELFLIRHLVETQRFEQGEIFEHLLAWHARRRRQLPFLVFLSEVGGLPFDEGRQAAQFAERNLIELRNQIAYNRIQSSSMQVQVDRSELGPEHQLPALLESSGRLSWEESQSLDRAVNRALRRAAQKAIEVVCRRYDVQPAPLHELEKQLTKTKFAEVYRWVVTALVRTI